MGKLRKVNNIKELVGSLYTIGIQKRYLPLQLRGWLNILGLYVQLRSAGGWVRLGAGGKFRSYFDALCRDPSNFDTIFGILGAWEIRRFDQQTWETRFAHLVSPTLDIAFFVSSGVSGQFDENATAILMRVVQHFKRTGEWLSLPSSRNCANCGRDLTIEQCRRELCPLCGASLRLGEK